MSYPSTILIIGGSGKVARSLTSLLVARTPKPDVISAVRKEEQLAQVASLGATPLLFSVEDPSVTSSSVAALLKEKNVNVVVWSAGAGGKDGIERTHAVDRDGAIMVAKGCLEAGVKLVMVSCCDLRDRTKTPPSWYTEADLKMSERIHGVIGGYMEAKRIADGEIRKMGADGLKFVLVRPGGLTDGATGKVRLGKVGICGMIGRGDVAGVVEQALGRSGLDGLAVDVLGNGEGETEIKEGLDRIENERVDCFWEGE